MCPETGSETERAADSKNAAPVRGDDAAEQKPKPTPETKSAEKHGGAELLSAKQADEEFTQKQKLDPIGTITISRQMVDDKPVFYLLTDWPKRLAFSKAIIEAALEDGTLDFVTNDEVSLTFANASAEYSLDKADADGLRIGALLDGNFEEPPAPEVEDPELVALRSGLEAPGHALGDSLPLTKMSFLEHSGFRGIGVDTHGRVWAVEEDLNVEVDEPTKRLVFVGRLVR